MEQCIWRMGLSFTNCSFSPRHWALYSQSCFSALPQGIPAARGLRHFWSASSLFSSTLLSSPTALLWKDIVSVRPAQTLMGIPTHNEGTNMPISQGTWLCWGPVPGWEGSIFKWYCGFISAEANGILHWHILSDTFFTLKKKSIQQLPRKCLQACRIPQISSG